jgi:membrane protease YdiL (CAAX protease family)
MLSEARNRILVAILVSLVIFASAITLRHLIASGIVSSMIVTQSTELILSILAIAVLGKAKFSAYGFRLPRKADGQSGGGPRWWKIALAAFGIGVAASVAMVALGGSGVPSVKQMTPGQMILFVWLISSIVEEVLTRGLLLGHMANLSDRVVRIGVFRVRLPILISAAFFSCMHIVIIFAGADAVTSSIVLPFTFLLGLIAGHACLRSGSLLPAIGLHMLANIGGAVGGMIAMTVKVLAGRSPF